MTAVSVMSDSAPPFGAGNTSSVPTARGRPRSSSTQRADSGTRCSFCAFIRAAGTVQIFLRGSISDHSAPRTSPERDAHRIANSRARAAVPSRPRSCAMKALLERAGRCLRSLQGSAVRAALFDRVYAFLDLVAGLASLVPGLRERHTRVSAQAHVAALAPDHRAQDPASRARLEHLQVQAWNGADRMHARFVNPRHRSRIKVGSLPSHVPLEAKTHRHTHQFSWS